MKKKSDSAPSTTTVQRIIPLVKVAPEAKKMELFSVAPTIKPVLRLQTTQRLSDLEDYDEDELLADSPTPPVNPLASTTNIGGGMFSNRRVVLTSTADTAKQKLLATTNTTTADKELSAATASKSKGIFDRLDRKIGINEAAKRKIQKIVIKSND